MSTPLSSPTSGTDFFASFPPSVRIAAPSYQTFDAGSGSGAAGDSSRSAAGQGAGSGAGDPQGAGGTGTGGGAHGGAPYRLSDESLIDFGDGKPVKWSEARASRYVDKSQYDDYVSRWNEGVKFLSGVAKMYDERGGQGQGQGQGQGRGRQQGQQQGQQGQQGRLQPMDLDELSGMPVVDGATIAKLARNLQDTQLAPIGNLLQQMSTQLQTQGKQLDALRGATGTLADDYSRKEFDGILTSGLKSLPEIKGLKGVIPADDPDIRALAEDVFLSHDQKDPNLRREFPAMVAKRLEATVRIVRALDKAAAEEATANRRRFPNFNRGAASGSGQGGYRHQSGTDLARSFFGSAEPNT